MALRSRNRCLCWLERRNYPKALRKAIVRRSSKVRTRGGFGGPNQETIETFIDTELGKVYEAGVSWFYYNRVTDVSCNDL